MVRVIVPGEKPNFWVRCEHPQEIVEAYQIGDVLPALQYIEARVNESRFFAAGFISYEAAPAFDRALCVRGTDTKFPLLWFGMFENPEQNYEWPAADSIPSLHWQPDISRRQYDCAVQRIKQYIAAGDTYQVNYSFRMRGRFEGDPLALFRRLVTAQPSRSAAFIETDDFAVCSASPELFFSLNGRTVVARPMKGTMPRGLTALEDERNAESLRASEKNRAENVMIVDMVRNDLGRVADPGTVRVPTLFAVEKYPTVWQMTSTVTAQTDASVSDLLRALFPCASITGAPKVRTMQIIAELETSPRKIYTGAIGFIAPNRRAHFNVAIRTVLVDKAKGEAEYGVGGGIVWDSTAESEYSECLTKSRLLTEVRPAFELFETMRFSPRDGFFLLHEHLERLKDSVRYFDYPFDEELLDRMLSELDRDLRVHSHDSRVRLTLHRDGKLTFAIQPFSPSPPRCLRVKLAAAPIDTGSLFLYHKTTYRKMYDDASASCQDCDDVILWNERGEVTESTVANIVVELDGALFTPPVESGLLAGTFRARLLRDGIVRERVIMKHELRTASKLFLVNSVRGWQNATLVL